VAPVMAAGTVPPIGGVAAAGSSASGPIQAEG